jgi:hypothetical protein
VCCGALCWCSGARPPPPSPAQPGTEMVAAGYCMYGSMSYMMITTGKGVAGFTLDPTLGGWQVLGVYVLGGGSSWVQPDRQPVCGSGVTWGGAMGEGGRVQLEGLQQCCTTAPSCCGLLHLSLAVPPCSLPLPQASL